MSRFTDELRNLDGMRGAGELLEASAVIIDEMEKALREIKQCADDDFQGSSAASNYDTAKDALAMLEELSK